MTKKESKLLVDHIIGDMIIANHKFSEGKISSETYKAVLICNRDLANCFIKNKDDYNSFRFWYEKYQTV